MVHNPFASDLAQFDGDWGELPDTPTFDRLPDGRYQVIITGTGIERSKTSGRLQLRWEFTVVGGPHKNRRVWNYHGLDHADSLPYLKRDLAAAGLELGRLSDLPRRLTELDGVMLEVQLKTRGEYQNVYINKRLSDNLPQTFDNFREDDVPF